MLNRKEDMMEQYFRKYSYMVREEEQLPRVTEEEFMSRYGASKRRARLLRVILPSAAAAAVIVLASLLAFALKSEVVIDPASVYVQEINEGLMPIYDDIKQMEAGSEVCRQMGISSTIEGLLASSREFESQLDGMDTDDRMRILKVYYGRQTECVADLYRDCIHAYANDMIGNN